jgi:hypothetical protein
MSSVSGRDRAVSGRGSQPDRETSKDDLMPICIPIRSSFRDSTADEHTRDESRTREEPSIRLLAGVLLSNVATGLADVLIADDRPAVGNHLSDKGKRPPANAVKRQVSMLKGAMESWTGIARLTMSKILKAVFLTAFVFIGIAVFLRGELQRVWEAADARKGRAAWVARLVCERRKFWYRTKCTGLGRHGGGGWRQQMAAGGCNPPAKQRLTIVQRTAPRSFATVRSTLAPSLLQLAAAHFHFVYPPPLPFPGGATELQRQRV